MKIRILKLRSERPEPGSEASVSLGTHVKCCRRTGSPVRGFRGVWISIICSYGGPSGPKCGSSLRAAPKHLPNNAKRVLKQSTVHGPRKGHMISGRLRHRESDALIRSLSALVRRPECLQQLDRHFHRIERSRFNDLNDLVRQTYSANIVD